MSELVKAVWRYCKEKRAGISHCIACIHLADGKKSDGAENYQPVLTVRKFSGNNSENQWFSCLVLSHCYGVLYHLHQIPTCSNSPSATTRCCVPCEPLCPLCSFTTPGVLIKNFICMQTWRAAAEWEWISIEICVQLICSEGHEEVSYQVRTKFNQPKGLYVSRFTWNKVN